MYRIEGHEYMRADNANRVALYLGGDVYAPCGGLSRRGIAEAVAALPVGESVTLRSIPWQGREAGPVTVTNVGVCAANGWLAA